MRSRILLLLIPLAVANSIWAAFTADKAPYWKWIDLALAACFVIAWFDLAKRVCRDHRSLSASS